MNLYYKNVMGQNKIMCVVITESIGKMDQEGPMRPFQHGLLYYPVHKKPNHYLLQNVAPAPFK